MGKVSFLAGLGVGFVLGARAGRGQYEKIKRQATNVWENPRVSELREQATEKAGDLAKQAPGAAASAVRSAAEKVGEVVEERRSGSAEDGADGPDGVDAPMRPTPPQPAPDAGS